MEGFNELRHVEPDHVRTAREGGGGGFEEAGLARDRAEGDDGDGLARGGARREDAGGDEQVGGEAGEARGDPGLDPSPFPLGDLGPNRTCASPAASRPDDAQRTAWPQNLWWYASPARCRHRQVPSGPTQSTRPSP